MSNSRFPSGRPSRWLFTAIIAILFAALLTYATALPLPSFAETGSGEIRGEIRYDGAYRDIASIIVGAVPSASDGPPSAHAVLAAQGPYTLTLASAGTHAVFAYVDIGSDMLPPRPDEPFAWYDADADGTADVVTVTDGASLTGIDIRLTDPPATVLVTGIISYSGAVSGVHTVWVGAFVGNDGPPAFSVTREGPGPYTMTVTPGVYSFLAGLDTDSTDGTPNPAVDPMGSYLHNPLIVTVGSFIADIDIVLLDPGTPPPGTGAIGGRITYQGRITQPHNIIVVAGRQGEEGPPSHSAVIPGSGPYAIVGVVPGNYWVFAFMDTGDDMGPPDPGEPQAWYDPNADGTPDLVSVVADGQTTGIDIIVRDAPARLFFPVAVKGP
jgi:hypothetical protein